MNYNGLFDGKIHRDQRRMKLFESYQFECSCAACNLSDEELKTQNDMCDEFITTWIGIKTFGIQEMCTKFPNVTSMIDIHMKCYKELYRIAEKLNIFKRREILEKIVEGGFNAASLAPSDSGEYCNYFANIGLEISMVVPGVEQSETIKWIERNMVDYRDI